MNGTSESPHNYITLVSNQSDVVMGCIDIQLNVYMDGDLTVFLDIIMIQLLDVNAAKCH